MTTTVIRGGRGSVHLWSRRNAIPERVRDCVALDVTIHAHNLDVDQPPHADYYIVSSLDTTVEWEAARLGALPVVLPEAHDWLTHTIARRLTAGERVVIAMRWVHR